MKLIGCWKFQPHISVLDCLFCNVDFLGSLMHLIVSVIFLRGNHRIRCQSNPVSSVHKGDRNHRMYKASKEFMVNLVKTGYSGSVPARFYAYICLYVYVSVAHKGHLSIYDFPISDVLGLFIVQTRKRYLHREIWRFIFKGATHFGPGNEGNVMVNKGDSNYNNRLW